MYRRKSMKQKAVTEQDAVDRILLQWARERPDLDVSPMGIIGRISRIERLLDPRLVSVFRKFGLERWSFDVLASLRRSGPPYELTPTQLFSSLMLTSGAITYRIDEMVKKGFVMRTPDPEDRRGQRIRLTDLGQEILDAALAAHVMNESRILKHLSVEERTHLSSLLRKLLLGLEPPAISASPTEE
jgi:DNA-binding MarR family transcriptional regulator